MQTVGLKERTLQHATGSDGDARLGFGEDDSYSATHAAAEAKRQQTETNHVQTAELKERKPKQGTGLLRYMRLTEQVEAHVLFLLLGLRLRGGRGGSGTTCASNSNS
jgi:hypothetical protein